MSKIFQFQLIERNLNKVIVRQPGNPRFDFCINTNTLTCACSPRKSDICKHLEFYFNYKGVSPYIIPYLKIPEIRNKIRDGKIKDGATINQICRDFLYDEEGECSICLSSLLSSEDKIPRHMQELFHMCGKCNNIVHQHCNLSWGKGCVICKKGHPEPKKDSYGRTEDFPALC